MKLFSMCGSIVAAAIRITNYPNTTIDRSRVPGLKFGFTGSQIAITFGPNTSDTTFMGCLKSNPATAGLTYPITPSTFEMRVIKWAYGLQKSIKVADFPRTIKVFGDSLSAGIYATYEIYPASHLSKKPAADIVIVNLGTNDNNSANNVRADGYVAQCKMLVEGVHKVYPTAPIILLAIWEGFSNIGNTCEQFTTTSDVDYVPQIYSVYEYFNTKEYLANAILYDLDQNTTYPSNQTSTPFVHYFNTTGHLIQYIKMKFDWVLYATGSEVSNDTLYWNDNSGY
ncbi:hypothetical protein N431DRAFT_539766 [Stipitochalara longipes BDJ]|nr:hypothetical protein N431DRAFT_539766 [Stipitochalara longipes BDJ]